MPAYRAKSFDRVRRDRIGLFKLNETKPLILGQLPSANTIKMLRPNDSIAYRKSRDRNTWRDFPKHRSMLIRQPVSSQNPWLPVGHTSR